MTAVEFKVPSGGLPGGIKDVAFTATFSSYATGLTVNWQWAAAAYTSFDTDYNAVGVKPVDDNKGSEYKNSDHAGTPENFKSFVTGGATGGDRITPVPTAQPAAVLSLLRDRRRSPATNNLRRARS
jgi:hypothetical protein